MDESFRARVSPPILFVLRVIELIEHAPQSAPDAVQVRRRFKELVGRFDIHGVYAEHYRLAKSALVYWADEVLINSTWQHAAEWKDDPLELEYYGTRHRAWRFFLNADKARGLDGTESLEVFALCVANGFRGVYRHGGLQEQFGSREFASSAAKAHSAEESRLAEAGATGMELATEPEPIRVIASLPGSLQEWASAAFVQVLGEPLAGFMPKTPLDSTRDARPLVARFQSVRWLVLLAGLVVITGITLIWGT